MRKIKRIFIKDEIKTEKRGKKDEFKKEDEQIVNETRVIIDRSLYNQRVFEKDLSIKKAKYTGYEPIEELKQTFHKHCFCGVKCVKKQLYNRLPIIKWTKSYKFKEYLLPDILTGLTIGVMHIPQGMAYSLLATLPPIYGLFTSFFAPLIYMLFGTSRHLSLGPFAFASLMIARVIRRLDDQYVQPVSNLNVTYYGSNFSNGTLDDLNSNVDKAKLIISITLTFWVGLVQIGMCFLQLGFLTTYFAEPLVNALTTGVAVQVVISQLKAVFGVNVRTYSGNFNLILSVKDFFMKITQINIATLIVSVVCIVFLLILKIYVNERYQKRLLVPIPIELLVVVIGTAVSYFANLKSNFKVSIIGNIPAGFTKPELPDFNLTKEVIVDAIIIAVVIFATNISQADNFAKKHKYKINSNQELLAYGLCNVGTAFFSGFINAGSLARSSVQDNAGGKTQLVSLFSSLLVCIVLIVLAPLFRYLPQACLAAIILVSLKSVLLQVTELKFYWKINKLEFLLWLVTFLSVVILDVDIGLAIGIIFYIISFFIRSSRPYITLLGNIPSTEFYKDIKLYDKAREIKGIKIIRMEHSIHAINAIYFKKSIYELSGLKPEEFLTKLRKYEMLKRANERKLTIKLEESTQASEATEFKDDSKYEIIQLVHENKNSSNDEGSYSERHTRTIRLLSVIPETPLSDEDNPNAIRSIQDLEEKVYNHEIILKGSQGQRPRPHIHYLIIDCSPINYTDSVGVKTLTQLIKDYNEIHVKVYLAECRDAFINRIRVMENASGKPATDTILSPDITHLTIHDAVIHALLDYEKHQEIFN